MDKQEIDFEIQETKKAITELELSGDYGAVIHAKADLKYFMNLK